jgi:hypothetical protein
MANSVGGAGGDGIAIPANPGSLRAGSSTAGGATGAAAGNSIAGASGSTGSGGIDNTSAPVVRVYGVTLDAVDPLDDIVQSLQMLARKPTVRVVLDPMQSSQSYLGPVQRIHAVASVMAELLDSINVASFSTDDYTARATDYVSTLGDEVDVWEIGNEINGEWLGESADVTAKIQSAYRIAVAHSKTTALTLYYNQGCYQRADHEMFTWAQANIPDEMKTGLDYVLVSYYDDNCVGPTPDWNSVFARLAKLFPHSKVGFGECGTTDTANKTAYVDRYYGLQIAEPAYVGGYFWWYYRQDMVPYTQPLWSVLNQSIAQSP